MNHLRILIGYIVSVKTLYRAKNRTQKPSPLTPIKPWEKEKGLMVELLNQHILDTLGNLNINMKLICGSLIIG